jgi:O-antigen/teichoic acid export membrane protein
LANKKKEQVSAEEQSSEKVDDWIQIGFHRPLGGVLYNLIFILIAAGFGILFSVWFIPNIIFPFPAAIGYQETVFSMFSLIFTLLDVGTGNAMQRFVAEENIKNPKGSIKYLQLFTWYQMISGLTQTTGISMWAIFFVEKSNLAYAAWFIVIYSTIQYPGSLWVFNGALQSYQRFDKASLVSFIQTQVFENGMRITFILLFRYIGTLVPELGELMGATIGSIMGYYLKDFIAAFVSAKFLAPVLRQVDPSYKIRDLFGTSFDRKIVKKVFSFGIRAMAPGLIYPAANFIWIIIITGYMPNYASILGMWTLGNMLTQMVTTFNLNMTTTVSESYLNGKIRLSQYYIAQAYKWNVTTGMFMVGLLYGGAQLLGIIVGSNFFLVVPIIQINIFFKIFDMLSGLNDGLFQGVGKPEINILLIGVEQIVRITVLYFMVVWFQYTWLALVVSPGVGWIVKTILGLGIFNKKIFRTKGLNAWQTIVAPGIAALVEAVYILVLMTYLFPVLSDLIGSRIVAAVIGIIIGIFTGPFFIYFPVLAFFGGFDDESLIIVEKVSTMSGPSKFLVNLIKTLSIKAHKISPFRNRFPIKNEGVQAEIEELMIIRKNNLDKQ